MRLALREHAANFVEMPDLDHRLGLRRNSDLAFDVERGTGRRYVADQAIDCCPVECDRGALQDALAPGGRCSFMAASARRIYRLVSWPVAEPASVAIAVPRAQPQQ
jgi:hypothetical protein